MSGENYTKVAVAGATGNLGPSIVAALVNAKFQVFALSRSGNTSGLPSSVKTVKVDYTVHASVVAALKDNGIEALVSNLPKHDEQIPLIDAAIEAGVKRFLPSDFGSNVSGNEKCAELPVFKNGKKVVQEYLKKKQGQISWTVIVNGIFFDWGLKVGFLMNFHGGVTPLYDNPDAKHSMTTLADVGQAVAGVLHHPEETKNKSVYVQSACLSQTELLAIAKKIKPDAEFPTEKADTEDLMKESYKILENGGDVGTAMVNFIKVSIFNEAYGSNWCDKNDNELLGVKGMSEKEVEEVVKQNI